MPELPEVENVARGLQHLVRQKLCSLDLFDPKVWFESELPVSKFQNLKLLEVTRRGKYLIFRFEKGITLLEHLRMTGKMLEEESAVIPMIVREQLGQSSGKGVQIRARFQFEKDCVLFFDTRRFGTLTAITDEEKFFAKKKIAPDPIATPERAHDVFLKNFSRAKVSAKAALLNQSVIAGVGNIYADEALHAVGIDPRTPAYKVKDPEKIWKAVLKILRKSVKAGGSTINDYVGADGKRGTFALQLMVYGRTGEPCRACGEVIERVQLAGRSTHFCPECQPKRPLSSPGKTSLSKARLKSGKGHSPRAESR